MFISQITLSTGLRERWPAHMLAACTQSYNTRYIGACIRNLSETITHRHFSNFFTLLRRCSPNWDNFSVRLPLVDFSGFLPYCSFSHVAVSSESTSLVHFAGC